MNHLRCTWISLIPRPTAPRKSPINRDTPIFFSYSQYQYVESKMNQTARVNKKEIIRYKIRFSQNCGLTRGIPHSSRDFSCSSSSFSMTSRRVSTLNSYFRSQSFWYTSRDTRIKGALSLLRPGIVYDNNANNDNSFVNEIYFVNKLYIGGGILC